MADWTRNLVADYPPADFTTVDGNAKLDAGANPPLVELAPDADVFGSVINNWTEMTPVQFNAGWGGIGEGSATWEETGGVLRCNDGGVGVWIKTIRRNTQYADADPVLHISNTKAAVKTYVGLHRWTLWRNSNNWVAVTYRARSAVTSRMLIAEKIINGAYTKLSEVNIGNHAVIYLRIKRIRGVGTQSFQFDWSYDGAAWNTKWSGAVYDAVHFNENHLLYPIESVYCGATADTDFSPEHDKHYQYTGAIVAQRFWPDSPECNIINSAAGAVEYVADMGIGNTFAGTGFADTALEPGTSTVKYRAAWGDAVDRVSATWINAGAWMTEAQLDAQVAAGALDGHRYLFLQAQFNSDGTDQPTLTNITISGAVVAGGGMTGPFGNLNRLGRSVA